MKLLIECPGHKLEVLNGGQIVVVVDEPVDIEEPPMKKTREERMSDLLKFAETLSPDSPTESPTVSAAAVFKQGVANIAAANRVANNAVANSVISSPTELLTPTELVEARAKGMAPDSGNTVADEKVTSTITYNAVGDHIASPTEIATEEVASGSGDTVANTVANTVTNKDDKTITEIPSPTEPAQSPSEYWVLLNSGFHARVRVVCARAFL